MTAERRRRRREFPLPSSGGSPPLLVQAAEQVVDGLLDLVVVVLRGALLGADEGRAVELREVPVRESVTGLGLLRRLLVDREVPFGVPLVPVPLDLPVLVVGRRRGVRPLGRVVPGAGVDELPRPSHAGLVHAVGGHGRSLPRTAGVTGR